MEQMIVFSIGAAGYCSLEVLWRGYTHWTMAVTGGICLLLLYRLNNWMPQGGLLLKCLAGALLITAVELAVGYIVNIRLAWQVWDYSSLPLNFRGQICALYSALWFVMCMPLMRFCTALRAAVTQWTGG